MISRQKIIIGGLKQFQFCRQIQRQSSHTRSPVKRIAAHPTFSCPYLGSLPVQQDDYCKDFYMEIVNGSLESAYKKYGPSTCLEGNEVKQGLSGKSVLIVGAGVAGLSAAFELEKVGHSTQILELQHRVGGRTKTLRGGFSDGLHAEGGAMRIPPNHYLTNGYIQKFGIPVRPFINYNDNTWLYLDGESKIRTKEWNENNRFYSTKFFPGWDSHLQSDIRPNVDGIMDLYKRTIEPVKEDLLSLIKEKGPQEGWKEWVEKWSKLSVDDFLRTNINSDLCSAYRPWPEAAIRGLQISTYSPAFGTSLVEYLRDELGEWWTDRLHTPVDGMDTIAKNFIQPQHTNIVNTTDLAKRIQFGAKVRSVKRNLENKVEVTARNVMTGTDQIYTADAVIITVPLTILRQMDIDLAEDCRKAIGNIHYQPSTKVVLQCKTRFWEKEVGQGGFSKTDLPIGQLHYPSPNDPRIPNGRGLLVCYTWEQDALIFGSQSETEAVESAVREITKIHPEMKNEFEVGMVQAWFNDNSAQGAYASLLPNQYNSGMKTLMTPDHPIYLAGEAISYTNGWIQGAIESGLNAAYHLYCNGQKS